jgi:2-dehydropantoate 2-reductase
VHILIVGAGIIGSIYGWALSAGGNSVTHLVRRGKAPALASGIPIDMFDKRRHRPKHLIGRYPIRTIEAVPTGGFELVIVPTKPYQLQAALEQVSPQLPSASYLLLTQNWHGTEEVDHILVSAPYLYGDAKAGGIFRQNTLVGALFPTLDLGLVHHEHSGALDVAASALEPSGIQAIRHDNILHYIWVQYAINAGLWPALIRAGSLDRLLRDRQLGDKSLQAVKECLDVVAARGVDLAKFPETRMFYNPSPIKRRLAGYAITIMFRFNEGVRRSSAHALGDPREIELAYFNVLHTGRDHGLPMPVMSSFETEVRHFADAAKIAAA